jgi:cellulose synthase/poly-beta-1,6-N-acetylglucosamine synthase-like glycosyltransferase
LAAAWNEGRLVRRFIESVLGLSYPNYELVLCAGGEDDTWKIASEYQGEKLILLEQQPGEGKQHSLQRSLEKASGEIIYLIDADCQISNETFTWTLAPIINQGEQAVSGSLYTPFPEQLNNPFVISQCATRLYAALHQPRYGTGLQGANSAIARQALEQAGGFRSEVRTGTDYDLAKRLWQHGIRIRFEENSSILSEFPTRLSVYYRQQARWVRNVVIHGLRYKAYNEVLACLRTSLVGAGMLFLPVFCLGLSFFPGIAREIALVLISGWVFVALFAFLSRLRYLSVARLYWGVRYPGRALPRLLFFLWIDFIAWTIPLGEYAVRSLRNRW